jgi:hypothetical protein
MILLSGRVPGGTPEPSRSRVDNGGRGGTFRGFLITPRRITPRGVYIGERVALGGSQGGHTLGRHGLGPGRAALWCGAHLAPLWPALVPSSVFHWENDFRTYLVQFREYFLCRISETKNSRKQELALRHLVNRLVPEIIRKRYKVWEKHVINNAKQAWSIKNYRYVWDVSASPSLTPARPRVGKW